MSTPPPLPHPHPTSWPGSCCHHPQAPGDVLFYSEPGRGTNPFAGLSQHCWDLLALSQRISINAKGQQKGSNYRKYKQHENSHISKLQVSQPQITTLECKRLAHFPVRPRARTPALTCWPAAAHPGSGGPGTSQDHPPPRSSLSRLRVCLGCSWPPELQ